MNTTPCDPKATREARVLLQYLASIEGKGILTGQHTQSIPMEELQFIRETTGKTPALLGFELLGYSPNINREESGYDCLKEVDDNLGTVECALDWGKKGGIVTYTWHWFSPIGGSDKAFYAEHTDFDAAKAATPGTDEYKAMLSDLDVMAEILRKFQDAKIPILWRPFHEAEGKWFWWGAKGPEVARDLFKIVFDHLTKEKGIHNLLWVWNCPIPEAYVGDEYCDIISRDLYPEAHAHASFVQEFKGLKEIAPDKGVSLAENGVLPDADALKADNAAWLWFMTWSHEFCLTEQYNSFDALKKLYENHYSLTFESLGDYYKMLSE